MGLTGGHNEASLDERHMQMAETMADCYSASRPRLFDRDEARQLARITVFQAGSSANSSVVRRKIENALSVTERKLRRRLAIAPTVSLSVIGLDDGRAFDSCRDLRSAPSLNPHADISAGMAEAVNEIRQSAVVQCLHGHPDHGRYCISCSESRDRVAGIRDRA